MSTKMFQEDFDFLSETTNMSIPEDSLPLTTKEDFFMRVDDVRPYAGFGTYVIGEIISGGISEGDEVEHISSESTKKEKIKHIKLGKSLVDSALAGKVYYILLEDVFYKNVKVGDYICFPGILKKCNEFEAYIYIFNKEKNFNKKIELSNGNILSFNINKSKFDGKIELLEELAVIPNGVSVKIKVSTDKPVFIKTTYESIKVNHLENEYVGFGVIVGDNTRNIISSSNSKQMYTSIEAYVDFSNAWISRLTLFDNDVLKFKFGLNLIEGKIKLLEEACMIIKGDSTKIKIEFNTPVFIDELEIFSILTKGKGYLGEGIVYKLIK